MNILVIGINHKTSSLEIRERFCLNPTERELLLSELKSDPSVIEAFVLSTCNRTEIYAHVLSQNENILLEMLMRIKKIPDAFNVKKNFYIYKDRSAVKHLMRVVSGLDSLVIGEKQILGQMKESVELSRKMNMMGKYLNILTNTAIRAGKKSRTETQIDSGGSSVSWAAVEMAQKYLGSLQDRSVLILGAGKMSSLAACHLKKKGVSEIFVVNRTMEKARELATQFGGKAASFWELKTLLSQVDVCICSAGAPHFLIESDLMSEVHAHRQGKKLILIDISVPRNVNPEVSVIPGVVLLTIDDLTEVVDGNIQKRHMAVDEVERIIEHKIEEFYGKIIKNTQRSIDPFQVQEQRNNNSSEIKEEIVR